MNKYIPIVQATINFIEENLTESISVKDIAVKSGLSIWQYQRIFRSMLGDSIGNYLRHRRLTLAAERLKDTDERIIDIAIDFEFSSQEAFSRAFKAYFQETPNQMRKSQSLITTKNKPIITLEHVKFLNGGISMTPEVIIKPAIKLIGMEIKLEEVFSRYNDFNTVLVPFWKKFLKRSNEVKNRCSKHSIGLIKNELFSEDDHYYLASFEVTTFDHIPVGMVCYEIPEQTYAVFSNIGLGDKTSYTMNYIYGTWLPTSQYLRTDGDEFELFGKEYSMGDNDSLSFYYLPISDLKVI